MQVLATKFNLSSAVHQYMRGKGEKNHFPENFLGTWPFHDVRRSCLYSGPLGLSNLTPNFIMLKEMFLHSQKGSGRAGILGMHGRCSLQGMPSPRHPCGHTPFMSPPFAACVYSETFMLGNSCRNNRFRTRRESPGENLGRKKVGGSF